MSKDAHGPEEEGEYGGEYASYHQSSQSQEPAGGLLQSPGEGREEGSAPIFRIGVCTAGQENPCAQRVSFFGEAWKWAKKVAKSAWHKAVAIVHWAINTQYKADHPGMRSPYTTNVANTCEVVGAGSLLLPLPGGAFGKLVGGVIWASC